MAKQIDPLETMPVSPYARPTRWVLWLWAVAVLVFLYLPIAFLVLFSFNEPRTPGLPIVNLTLHWYEVAAGNSLLLEAVKNSIIVAAAVAFLATLIGTMAAFPLVRGRHPARRRRPDPGHDADHAARHPARNRDAHLLPARPRPRAVAPDGDRRPPRVHDARSSS